MISEWSDNVVLRFTCDGQTVEGLVVHLLLLSNRKNSFPMGPFLSDANGEILLTRDSMASAVESEKIECPMDYDGTLADCPGVEIIVDDDVGLCGRMDRLKEFYPDEAAELSSLVAESANKRFRPIRLKVKTPPDGAVEVVLRNAGAEEK